MATFSNYSNSHYNIKIIVMKQFCYANTTWFIWTLRDTDVNIANYDENIIQLQSWLVPSHILCINIWFDSVLRVKACMTSYDSPAQSVVHLDSLFWTLYTCKRTWLVHSSKNIGKHDCSNHSIARSSSNFSCGSVMMAQSMLIISNDSITDI